MSMNLQDCKDDHGYVNIYDNNTKFMNTFKFKTINDDELTAKMAFSLCSWFKQNKYY